MDTGSVSLSQHSYPTSPADSGPKAAVLQALASTYTAAVSAGSGDPLAAAAGGSAIGALASGITALTGGEGARDGNYAPHFGGLNVSSATSLLASLGSGSSPSSDLDASVGANAALAITAYQAKGAFASAATGTPSGTGSDAASLQAAKAAAATSTLDLLG